MSDLEKGCELSSIYRLWPALEPRSDDCARFRRLWRIARDKKQYGDARQLAYDYWVAKRRTGEGVNLCTTL